jgi:ribosomal subunit interface protein
MQIQVSYHNLDNTPWLSHFIERKVSKLDRYLAKSANVQVHVKFLNRLYITNIMIHNPQHDYAFTAEAENLYESFSMTVDKASRALGEHKRQVKDRINKKYFSLKTEFQTEAS